MKTLKWTALMLSGGVLLQLGGCASVIADLALNALITQLASSLLTGATGTGA